MDTVMNEFFVTGFSILFLLGLFIMIESYFVQKFNLFFFNLGIKVKKTTIDTTGWKIVIPNDSVVEKAEGKFYFSTDNKIYFFSLDFWYVLFRVKTPFPIRSIATIRYDNQIEIISKIPVSTTLFIISFFILWTVLATNLEIARLLWIGWGVCLFIVTLSYFTEKKRLTVMIAELKSIISDISSEY